MGLLFDQGLNTSDAVQFQGVVIGSGSFRPDTDGTRYNGDLDRQWDRVVSERFFAYNLNTDASNYERGGMWWDSNALYYGSDQAGTGAARTVCIQRGGATRISMTSNAAVTIHGGLYPSSNRSRLFGYDTLQWREANIGGGGGLKVHNTADATNYERMRLYHDGTEFVFASEIGGTGTQQNVLFNMPFRWETPSGSGSDFRMEVTDGSNILDIFPYASNTSPRIRLGGAYPGTSQATTLWHSEGGGVNRLNIGDLNGVIEVAIRKGASGYVSLSDTNFFGISSTQSAISPDVKLYRDDVGVWAVRNDTNAMAMRFYNTWTDASNNEYLEAGFDTNDAYLRVVNNGTGTARDLRIYAGTSKTIFFGNGTTPLMQLTTSSLSPDTDGLIQCGTNTKRFSWGYFDDVAITNDLTLGAGGTQSFDLTTSDDGFINFQATADADATSAISTLTTSGSTTHHIQVEINGTKAWIAASTNAPS